MPIIVVNKSNEDLNGRSGDAFKSNALDTIKTTFTLELDTTLVLNAFLGVNVVKVGDVFTLTSGNWNDLIGAFVGGGIEYSLDGGSTITTTIVSLNGAVMQLTAGIVVYADGNYSVGEFKTTNSPEEFNFSVNLVENSIGSGLGSLIDSENQRFSVVLNNALIIGGGVDLFAQLGNRSGGSQFTTKTISRLADSTVSGNKQYQLIVEYKNWLCIDPSVFNVAAAVGDYYEFRALMIASDPSSTVSGIQFQDGNTGFQNENFNGYSPDYVLTSIVWTDANSNVIDAFDFSQPSDFNIEIAGANLSLADTFNFKMFSLPNDPIEYSNKPAPVENNLMLIINPSLIAASTLTAISGNLNENGAGIDVSNLLFTVSAGTSVSVRGTITPNAAFTALYASKDIADRKYKIWIECSDVSAAYTATNTVNVLADYQNAKEDIQPLGEMLTVTALTMEDHNEDIYVGVPDLYLEDDALVNIEYTLPKNTVSNDWLSIRMRMVAVRASDNSRFTLEEFIYDVSNLPANQTTGVLPIDYVQNRGFNLPATSDKHDVSVQLYPLLDTISEFGIKIRYPFITRYESWLPMPQATANFFNANSQNWYPYSASATWSLQFEIANEVAGGEYINALPFIIHTYNDWGEVPGSSFSFQKVNTTPITVPYSDEKSRIIATHELDTEDWTGNEWGLIHVRPENGAPQWLVGSVLVHSEPLNALEPLTGETKAFKTVTTKKVTIECLFDPSKIDTSGKITFTSRVSGSTAASRKGNIYKESYTLAKSPILPQFRDQNLSEEDRGYKGCCDPTPVIADESTVARNNNDIAFPRAFGSSVTFNVTKDGLPTAYTATSLQFPNQPDAWYAQIEWRDLLLSNGAGCYSIDIVSTVAGNVQPSFNYGKYVLKPYKTGGYLHSQYTARILSEFNDKNDLDGIDYTGSFALESLRINRGKFGYFNPNTEIDKVEYLDGTNEKVKTEDFFEYELRLSGVTMCVVNPLMSHLRGMTNCWMSSYNYDDFDYVGLSMKNVILSEGFVPEHIDGSRMINGVVKFQDKVFNSRAHFQDSRQTGASTIPPDAVSNLTNVKNSDSSYDVNASGTLILPDEDITLNGAALLTKPSVKDQDIILHDQYNNDITPLSITGNTVKVTIPLAGSVGLKLMKTDQTTSYRTGDDGDLQAGRNVDFFTLASNNPFGTTLRFTDEFGGSTYANNIVIDWSTFNGSEVLGYYRTAQGANIWDDAITNALALSISTFTSGWRLTNMIELTNLYKIGNRSMNWSPINQGAGNTRFWTSTTLTGYTNQPFWGSNFFGGGGVPTSQSYKWLGCRNFTVTGTTLT